MATDYLGFDVNETGTILFIIQVVFLISAWLASLMRAFVKLVLLRRVTIDDYLMLLSLLGYTVTGYFVISAVVNGGLGKPAAELGEDATEKVRIQLRALYSNMALSGPVSCLFRVSIALFLLRIAMKKWQRLVLQGIIITTTVTTIVYFFITVFQCSPPSYFWQMVGAVESGSCDLGRAVYVVTIVWGSLNAAMDWILGLLPIIVLWHVRINWQSKVGITSVLSFGIIAGIALIIRLVYIGENTGKVDVRMLAVSITATVELSLGIVAGCIVTLPPLFKKLRANLGSHEKSSPDTIPWQVSFIEPMPQRGSVENFIMASPRRLRGTRSPRPGTPSIKRIASSLFWDYEAEAGGEGNGNETPPATEIQVRTSISVTSQPSDGHVLASDVSFDIKPLPMTPPPPKLKDRPIRLRPHTPTVFI
ncbi:hypothetical protein F4861DRAFT_545202 [Xylaria intraflava]|nr:hypothetical protein F4861DRAFT_545202 [Xylaria intraflava]